MDTDVIMRKIKDNVFGLCVVAVCIFIAYKLYIKKELALKDLAASAETEKMKNVKLGEISGSEKDLAFFKQHINTKAPGAALNSLGNIAKESNVKLTFIKPGNEEKLADYTRYPFELSVIAPDYHSFARFISNLERAPEIYTVDSMNLNYGSEDGNATITAKLTVSTLLLN